MVPKMSVIFVRYSREFVITVIVITEFDCILFLNVLHKDHLNIIQSSEKFYHLQSYSKSQSNGEIPRKNH